MNEEDPFGLSTWLVMCVICNRVTFFAPLGMWRHVTSEEATECNFLDGLCPNCDQE